MSGIIESLKKVTLSIIVIDQAGSQLSSKPREFSFVFGVASEGLTPLESGLVGKSVADDVRLSIETKDFHGICGHLLHPLHQALQLSILPERFDLVLTVTEISTAADREIVEAVAKAVDGCGGNCDCGCSC